MTPPAPAAPTVAQVIERRKHNHPSELLELVRQIHDHQIEQTRSIEALDAKITDHIALEPVKIGEDIAAAMAKAFPDKDPEGHRRFHESLIQKAEEKAEFWRAMRKEIGKWGLISVLSFLAIAAWHQFLRGPVGK